MAGLYDYSGTPLDISSKTSQRSNPALVTQFLDNAATYLGQTSFVYGQNTIFDKATSTNQIDCSTYVILCLMGWPYASTPYATGVYCDPSTWTRNADYMWSINPMLYHASKYADGSSREASVRTAASIARWMIDRGSSVDIGNGLRDVEPGDIVFWARRVRDTGEWLQPDRFLHINHVGIVRTKEDAPETYTYTDGEGVEQTVTWDKSKYPYKHELLQVATAEPSPCVGGLLESGMEDPTNVYASNVNTIVCICRPDLGALSTASGGGSGPSPYNATPEMDSAEGAAGNSPYYARGNHKHPRDTSKLNKNQGVVNSGKILGVGSDGAVSPMALSEAGAAPAIAEVTVSSAGAVTQECADNTIYTFTGELTSLTLTQATGAREYLVIFTTGSTAPTVTFPSGVAFPDALTIEANKRYEVSVRDGYAVAQSWAVSA